MIGEYKGVQQKREGECVLGSERVWYCMFERDCAPVGDN